MSPKKALYLLLSVSLPQEGDTVSSKVVSKPVLCSGNTLSFQAVAVQTSLNKQSGKRQSVPLPVRYAETGQTPGELPPSKPTQNSNCVFLVISGEENDNHHNYIYETDMGPQTQYPSYANIYTLTIEINNLYKLFTKSILLCLKIFCVHQYFI